MELLLSIKPKYSEKIFSGKKRYEFRKQKPRRVVDRIFIYESHPSKNIVGWFSVKKIHSGCPEDIWMKCKSLSGLEEKNYFNYCKGSKIIYAFEIDKTFEFDNPINPLEIVSDFKPPQSFKYIDDSTLYKKLENKFDHIFKGELKQETIEVY